MLLQYWIKTLVLKSSFQDIRVERQRDQKKIIYEKELPHYTNQRERWDNPRTCLKKTRRMKEEEKASAIDKSQEFDTAGREKTGCDLRLILRDTTRSMYVGVGIGWKTDRSKNQGRFYVPLDVSSTPRDIHRERERGQHRKLQSC